MKRTAVVLWSGAVLYLLSWFLPVVDGGTTLARGEVPGWEAFRVALAPLWPYEGVGGDGGVFDLIAVVSALTNLWFVVAVMVLVARRERFRSAVLWGLVLSALINALWFVLSEDRADFRIGYYAWCGAFVVLAGAAYARSRSATGESPGAAAI